MNAGIKIENGSCDPEHALLWVVHNVIKKLGSDTVYLCAKFDDSNVNRSRDIIGGLTTPILRVICRSYAET